jgi:predicted transcriptional regulator with HTH domain
MNELSMSLVDFGYLEKHNTNGINYFKLTERGKVVRKAALVIANELGDSMLVNNHVLNK